MDVNVIRQVVRDRPFQPFRLNLIDGREFLINHPEVMAVSPTGRHLVLILLDGTTVYLEPLLVSSLELAPPAATATGNGASDGP